jgi:iron uptake system EfeUOB component EfeO/EfeM
VRRELGATLPELDRLESAIARGDLAAARAAWLRADARYETIGAAYGAFGALDAAINGLPGGLPGGVRSPDFTGLHRVELALWGRRSTADARGPARRLRRDVARLRARVGTIEIDPLDYGLRAHEVLEDTLQLELAGRASPWSGAALTALVSNIAGTRLVLRTLTPIAERSNPIAVRLAERSLARLDAAVRRLRGPDGSLPRWDALSRRQRELVAGYTAGAAERLAYIPGLVDPRIPRKAQTPTAVTGR